jgi:hypothetical protein
MKIKTTLVSPIILIFALSAYAQGNFQNLDFESAQIIPLTQGADYPPYSVATTNAVPGWTVFYGGTPQSQITYNDPALGSTFVNLWATNGQQISGNFSVLLQGGGTASSASISQTGLVPAGTQSLLFEAQRFGAGIGALQVFLGGQNLSFVALSSGANYTLYGVDVSAFAGQTEQLEFSALESIYGNNWNIDNIQFSSTAVPEPSALALTALGAVMLGFRRWLKPKP